MLPFKSYKRNHKQCEEIKKKYRKRNSSSKLMWHKSDTKSNQYIEGKNTHEFLEKKMKMSEMLSSVNSNNNNNNNHQNHYITPDYLSPTAASVSCQSIDYYMVHATCWDLRQNYYFMGNALTRVVAINYTIFSIFFYSDTLDSHLNMSCM